MPHSKLRGSTILVLIGFTWIASAAASILRLPAAASELGIWQSLTNATIAASQNISLSTHPSSPPLNTTLLSNSNPLPPDPFIIHVDATPISVRFSRYSNPIPPSLLYSIYRSIGVETLSHGTKELTSSQKWVDGAGERVTVYLWPKRGMTWEMWAFALSALAAFARTQGGVGCRFDVLFEEEAEMGFGAVVGRG